MGKIKKRDVYKDELLDILLIGHGVAIVEDKPVDCWYVEDCKKCRFNDPDSDLCSGGYGIGEWGEEVIEDVKWIEVVEGIGIVEEVKG